MRRCIQETESQNIIVSTAQQIDVDYKTIQNSHKVNLNKTTITCLIKLIQTELFIKDATLNDIRMSLGLELVVDEVGTKQIAFVDHIVIDLTFDVLQ